MPISLTEDIRTLAELTAGPLAIVKQVRQTGRPVVVTNKGKADVVVMDAATYEKRLKIANLSRLLMKAETDVQAGRTRPVREFLRELRRAKKVSG
ncbi:MAG: type II toxin-antitoxin system Phd/YefM family antitoxin [Pirellulaceae bacterium]